MLQLPLAPSSAARVLLLMRLRAEESVGHEFHGNQWTDRGGPAFLTRTDFKERFERLGYQTITGEQFPEEVADALKPVRPPVPMPKSVADGVEQGLLDIERELPRLSDILKQGTKLVYADYDPGSGAVAVSSPKGQHWIVINGKKAAMHEFIKSDWKPEETRWTVAQQRSGKMTGDERTRETYRGLIVHEVGHIADRVTNRGLEKNMMNAILKLPVAAKQDVSKFMGKSVSGYAAVGGPREAAAELFTAAVLDHPIPKEFGDFRKHVMGLTKLKFK